MMKPATSDNASDNRPERASSVLALGGVATVSCPGAFLEASSLDSCDLTVLQAVMSHSEPMTISRIARVTALTSTELDPALASLCETGLLRRLNTIVPSYTTRH
jgi:predicted transcriptional regulator